MTISPARSNHAIWEAPAQATAEVAESQIVAVLGNPLPGDGPPAWCVRDTESNAHLRVWGDEDGLWRFAWIDGPKHPESGRRLAEAVVGEPAGGVIREG